MDGLEISHNILSKESCDKIIELFDNDDRRQEGRTGPGKITKEKKSTDLYCNFTEREDNHYHKLIWPAVTTLTSIIKKKYPFLSKECDFWDVSEWYNIQKYEHGEGYFTTHCEQSSSYPQRMLAWMIYLNDAKCGTEFPAQKNTITAEKGKGAIWPAGWTHPHKGVTPNIGNKYIVTGWGIFYKPIKKV